VKEGAADYVLAPIENSLFGSIHRSYDLLLESGLRIQAEVVIPIVHHLIGPPRASFEQVAQVQSHPVALAQCERFFNDHPSLKRVPAEDTAGSVREVVRQGDPSRAAIAGRRAAEVYGASILKEHLEDHQENYTRFLLLGASDAVQANADKLSLVMHLAHRPGSLHDALSVFAWRDINLLKIESRPIPGRPWQYRFYLDLQASLNEPRTVAAVQELEHFVDDVKILGCYPHAQLGSQEIAATKKESEE
jgi:prephenate dehydratase